MIRALVFSALAVSGLIAADARACAPRFDGEPQVTGPEALDPFDAGPFEREIRLALVNDGGADCDLVVRALNAEPGARRLSGGGLTYQLVAPGDRVLANAETGVDSGHRLQLFPAQRRELVFRVRVDRPVFARPASGRALQDFVVFARETETEIVRRQVSVPVNVLSRAQANLAGVDAPFDRDLAVNQVSFGTLQPGAHRTVFLQLRANADVDIRFESEHGGALVNAAGGPGRVPYSARLSGEAVDLTGEARIRRPSPVSLDGSSLPLRFEIGAVPPVAAGRYEDRVVVTVTALPG